MKRIINIATFGLVLVVSAAMFLALLVWPTINVVETGATPEYPQVQPHYYSTDPGRVFTEARAAVESLERWQIGDHSGADRRLVAHRQGAIPGVDSTVTIEISSMTDYLTVVHLRSEGGRWRGDFGQNARTIEEFFTELDDRLGAVKFSPQEADQAGPIDGDSDLAED